MPISLCKKNNNKKTHHTVNHNQLSSGTVNEAHVDYSLMNVHYEKI